MDEYRRLADDMSAHMGKADFDAVLKDCHAGSLAVRELVSRLESAEKALEPTTNLGMWTESADDDEVVLMTVGTIRKMRAHMEKYHGR